MVPTMNTKTQKLGLSGIFSLLIAFSANNAFAAPGTLSNVPLFVTTTVEPNIFFTLDDSGSMDWEVMVPDTGDFAWNNGVPFYNGDWQAYLHPGWTDYQYYAWSSYNDRDRNIVPPARYASASANPLIHSFWVMYNHNYNSLYYNPLSTYTPWVGVDNSGNPLYADADPQEVTRDPNDVNHNSDLLNLTDSFDYYDNIVANALQTNMAYLPSYYTWVDDDNDGVLEINETHALVEINPATPTYTHTFDDGTTFTRTYAEEIQNFANWFEYYRKREFATKAAIGAVISKAGGSRMGLRLINGGHQINLKTMTDSGNKEDLLTTFYNINSNGGTPLRRALENTGEMFKYDWYNGDRPILNAANGGECQQNFALLMTDGFWNGSNPSVGNADRSTNNTGFDGDQFESNDGGNYEDSHSNTLADVAMYYYERDLRTNLADRVPTTIGVDEADHQHMVTYTVSFGVTGTLDPETYDPLASGFSWPEPDTDPTKVDDLLHAAYNGRGLYLSAQNPKELEASLSEALSDIEERKATSSSVSVTSARLTTDSVVYVSEFNTNGWQGNIFAYPIIETNGVLTLDVPADPLDALNAAEELSLLAKDGGYDTRVILTHDGTSGVPFRWPNISSDMKADLRINSLGNIDNDTIAQARLDYLRGDTSNEGTGYQFRERATLMPDPVNPTQSVKNVLGDIVHSGPVYVGKPNLNWPDEAPFPTGGQAYSEFKEDNENRPGMIYVGANAGMVHGFSETNLVEKVAYVPSNLTSTTRDEGLHYLTHSNYQHRFYNDLTPTVSDVYINGGWKTVALFGQRAGGRGYTLLDVTDPNSFSEANAANTVLWEFTSNDDADLGYTFSRPQIGLSNSGDWVAVFGNGYNNDGDGLAKLFVVKLNKSSSGAWTATDYIKIPAGSAGSVADPNGLSSPALADLDGNGTIDRAYAGDLNGKMWSFDLSSSSPTTWAAAGGQELFTTIGNRPITSKPALSFHPTISSDTSNTPNVMVVFGTGQYIVDADKNSSHNNYFYGVWDKGETNLSSSDLVEQTFRSGFSARVLTQNSVDYSSSDRGWYIHLEDARERTTTNPIIRSGFVFFNSNVPSDDACLSDGYGYRFAVDLETGGSPSEPVVDNNGDGYVDEDDTIDNTDDVQAATKIDRQLTDDTLTEKHIINQRDLTAIKDAPTRQTGRVSWQELLQ